MQKNKKYFLIFVLTIIAIFIYQRKKIDNSNVELSDASGSHITGSRQVASTDSNNSNVAIATTIPQDENSNDQKNTEPSQQEISANDPINAVLKKYEINYKNSISVNYDRWFISDKYIQIHTSEFQQGQAKVKEKYNNFYVVEHNATLTSDEHPPLVISYSTNQPIPITGNVLVKFSQSSQMQETIDFLRTDRELDELVGQVAVTPVLAEIRTLMVKPKKRGQFVILYEKLLQHIGQYNIEAVTPDANYQFTY